MQHWVRSVLALLAAALLIGAVGCTSLPGAPSSNPPAADSVAAPAGEASWYELYFTDPRYPDDPKNHRSGLDEKLVALIDRARTTLDVADYDFDLANVAEAMARAKARGVRVRMVSDTDSVTNTKDERIVAAFGILKQASIPVVPDNRPAIMHDKFTIVDGEWLSTGSWNYTDGDTYHLNNWMGIFHSRELAANYAAEFEQMFAGKFGPSKARTLPNPTLDVGGSRVTTCFSPKGECASLIVDTIGRATKSIQFMAFSFTHDGIGQAMIDKRKSGVSAIGVFETTGSQTSFSEYGKMKKAGLEVYTDGNPWVMHHKVIVLDERTVIAGSFNFSSNADEENDENLLVIEDAGIARSFLAEFDRVLQTAKNPPKK